ncbi:MAG: hypothetical protein HZB33_00050 [Nitrospirae bacterium]|nr:hypothetical protein [Nitrospirota bacterium]
MNRDQNEATTVTLDKEVSIDLAPYFRVLWAAKWKIVLFSLLVGALVLAYMYTLPNIYRATATIKPESSDTNKAGAGIGALASLGLPVGIPSGSENLEVLLKSDDLAIRVFRKYDYWPILLQTSYDSGTKSRKAGWLDRLIGGGGKAKPLGDWDAVREVRSRMKAATDRKTGVINISFESNSAEGSATILRSYLDEAKSRLQEEALNRANKNKEFIQGQITRTVDPLIRDRLFTMYGAEVEREMMAKNREQFGFTVIDSPKVPDRKAGPTRARSALVAAILAFFVGCGYFVFRVNNFPNRTIKD